MNIWLFIHVLGVVLFVGNIITAAFWKVRADISGNPAIIHSAAKNVMLADYCFTIPGLILIIVSGNLMAVKAGYPMSGLNWLTLSLFLFVVTGVIWLGALIPLQRSMIRRSAEAVQSGIVPAAYKKASMYWAVFGIAATLLPIIILYFMIFKNI